jgi:20S proteasome alpha/beta subunit
MTAIVGVFCSDGAVIGTDSSATFVGGTGHPTIEQTTEKLAIVNDEIVIAGTGAIGLGQRFVEIVRQLVKQGKFKGDEWAPAKLLTRHALEDFNFTYTGGPVKYGALVAFSCNQKPFLCEFELGNLQPEFKTKDLWYVSMGGSQPITDPFLAFIRNVYWGDGMPKVQDAVFAITWALDHAIETNPGGVNKPVRIAVLEKTGPQFKARMVSDGELEEHRQNIESAKDALRRHRTGQSEVGETEELPVPPEAG